MTNPERRRALLLTVGTGDINRLEESLLAPLGKSIDQGEWTRIVLLPSMVTEQYAAELKARCVGYPIDISPLSAPDLENDADRCFEHFDRAIDGLREGVMPGFNEAAALLPRIKRDTPRHRPELSAGFNEAAALLPRINSRHLGERIPAAGLQ